MLDNLNTFLKETPGSLLQIERLTDRPHTLDCVRCDVIFNERIVVRGFGNDITAAMLDAQSKLI